MLQPATVAEMTRNQLTAAQRSKVWPGFSFLDDRGWGCGLSVLDDGRYTWEGGLGTVCPNLPSQDLTVLALTQRAADETGMPGVCDDVLSAARATDQPVHWRYAVVSSLYRIRRPARRLGYYHDH